MFKKNVGSLDRMLRIVVGAAMIVGFFLGLGGSLNMLLLIGLIPLATGLANSCPLYSIFGINTCPVDKRT